MAVPLIAAGAPAIFSILGKLFGGDKKPVQYAAQFDPKTEAFRQSMMQQIQARQNPQNMMYARMPQQSFQRSDLIRNSLLPKAAAAKPFSYRPMQKPAGSIPQGPNQGISPQNLAQQARQRQPIPGSIGPGNLGQRGGYNPQGMGGMPGQAQPMNINPQMLATIMQMMSGGNRMF